MLILFTSTVNGGGDYDFNDFDLAIVVFPQPRNEFYGLLKYLGSLGMPRDKIIDGSVFRIPNLDFPRLLKEGVAYGIFENKDNFSDVTHTIYPRTYTFKNNRTTINLGIKSMINRGAYLEGSGIITFGNFSEMAWRIFFELGINVGHNHKLLTSTHPSNFDWEFPREFRAPGGICRINVGNDVWIGRGCILKCTNPKKPLTIGDGAVVAADSVVVKDIPPYAIVGGNPAQIIKYRFPPNVIESLLRIKWWDWSLDKIYENFKYFNDVEKFVSMHDEQFKRIEKADDNFDYLNLNYSNDDFKFFNDAEQLISLHKK